MAKDFGGQTPGFGGIPTGAFSVTPDDATDLAQEAQFLMVGADGDVALDTHEGETVTLSLKAGVQYWLAVKRVRATGTTATGIVGLY